MRESDRLISGHIICPLMEPFEFYSMLLWDVVEPAAFVAVIILLYKMYRVLREIERELKSGKQARS